jgi:deoxyribodipyrimidine photolyase
MEHLTTLQTLMRCKSDVLACVFVLPDNANESRETRRGVVREYKALNAKASALIAAACTPGGALAAFYDTTTRTTVTLDELHAGAATAIDADVARLLSQRGAELDAFVANGLSSAEAAVKRAESKLHAHSTTKQLANTAKLEARLASKGAHLERARKRARLLAYARGKFAAPLA